MRVALVTAGDVGGGHLSRGLAVARAFERAGSRVDYRVISRAMPFPALAGDARFTFVDVTSDELHDPERARASALASALRDFAPDLVLVDLFWGAVLHVLPELACEAWLLLRWHLPGWAGGPLNKSFDPRQYRRVIAIEPIARGDDRVEPVVVANPDELLPAHALKERLGLAPEERLTLVAQTGERGESARLAALAARESDGGRVETMSLWNEGALFPAAPWLAGADRIVGGAGYNLFWETRWLGLADRTRLVAFRRTIDDQAARVRASAAYAMRENGADTLVAQMLRG